VGSSATISKFSDDDDDDDKKWQWWCGFWQPTGGLTARVI